MAHDKQAMALRMTMNPARQQTEAFGLGGHLNRKILPNCSIMFIINFYADCLALESQEHHHLSDVYLPTRGGDIEREETRNDGVGRIVYLYSPAGRDGDLRLWGPANCPEPFNIPDHIHPFHDFSKNDVSSV